MFVCVLVSKSVVDAESIPNPLIFHDAEGLYAKLVAPNFVSISLALLFLKAPIPKSLDATLKELPPFLIIPLNPPVILK